MQETWIQPLGWEDSPEEGLATHSSILAWRSPWTEELGRLQFMRSQRVRHDWATNTFAFSFLFSALYFFHHACHRVSHQTTSCNQQHCPRIPYQKYLERPILYGLSTQPLLLLSKLHAILQLPSRLGLWRMLSSLLWGNALCPALLSWSPLRVFSVSKVCKIELSVSSRLRVSVLELSPSHTDPRRRDWSCSCFNGRRAWSSGN